MINVVGVERVALPMSRLLNAKSTSEPASSASLPNPLSVIIVV